MPTESRLRLATPADAPALVEIYRASIENSPVSFEYEVPSSAEFAERIREIQKKFPWLVSLSEEKISGYAYASAHRARAAYAWSVESTVYIDKEFQGRGLGRQLYTELFRRLRGQGVVNVFAGITLPNAGSVGLHEAFGFTPVAHFKDVGFKLERWWDVGWWQLQLQRPERPAPLKFFEKP